jgi:dUTP pyrophosphatase
VVTEKEMVSVDESTGQVFEEPQGYRERDSCHDQRNGLNLGEDYSFALDVPVKVKRLRPDAIMPKYYTKGAVAFDVCYCGDEDMIVQAHSQEILSTGLSFSIPYGYELRISPRSGDSTKRNISIRNSPGILDWDYTKELFVAYVNNNGHMITVEKGKRIAQVKLSLAPRAVFEEVNELYETERGEGCCNSTGEFGHV